MVSLRSNAYTVACLLLANAKTSRRLCLLLSTECRFFNEKIPEANWCCTYFTSCDFTFDFWQLNFSQERHVSENSEPGPLLKKRLTLSELSEKTF
jgi:hypothetical protein